MPCCVPSVSEKDAWDAISEDDPSRLGFVLSKLPKGVNEIRAAKDGQQTLLHRAVALMRVQCVSVLLQLKANPKMPDLAGRTPLHLLVATAAGSRDKMDAAVQIVQALANADPQRGAMLDMSDAEGTTPLLLAVKSRVGPLVDVLLHTRHKVNVANAQGQNALHLIAASGDPAICANLLKAAAATGTAAAAASAPDRGHKTPLHIAAELGHARVLEQLLQVLQGAQLDAQDGAGNTALHIALLRLLSPQPVDGAVECARLLLGANCSVDVPNGPGHIAVEMACALPRPDWALAILGTMAEGHGRIVNPAKNPFNVKSAKGLAPLHVACSLGALPVVMGLVKGRQADPNMPSQDGKLPVTYAAEAGQGTIAAMLVRELGANALLLDSTGAALAWHVVRPDSPFKPQDVQPLLAAIASASPPQALAEAPVLAALPGLAKPQPLLHAAAAAGNQIAVQMLLTQLNVNSRNIAGMTPLHIVVASCTQRGHGSKAIADGVQLAACLLENGAKPDAQDDAGITPVGLAMQAGNIHLLTVLIKHKKELVNAPDAKGRTPLSMAIEQGDLQAVKQLVGNLNAFVGAQQSFVPLHLAVKLGHVHIVDYLLSCAQVAGTVDIEDNSGMRALTYVWLQSVAAQAAAVHQSSHAGSSRRPLSSSGAAAPAGGAAAVTPEQQKLAELLVGQAKCGISYVDASGRTPLHWVVHHGDQPLLKLLATHGRDLEPNIKDTAGCTALCAAVAAGNVEMVQAMVQLLGSRGLDLNMPSTSVPQLATSGGGAPLTAASAAVKGPLTPLHVAVAAGKPSMVAYLVKQQVQVDRRALDLALAQAGSDSADYASICQMLLDPAHSTGGGIQLDAHDPALELHPLHKVAIHNRADLVRVFVKQAAAPVDAPDANGCTPLLHAVAARAHDAAAALVELGADICKGDTKTGLTPLISACVNQDPQMVELLLQSKRKYDVDAVNHQGSSALSTTTSMLLAQAEQQLLQDAQVIELDASLNRLSSSNGTFKQRTTMSGAPSGALGSAHSLARFDQRLSSSMLVRETSMEPPAYIFEQHGPGHASELARRSISAGLGPASSTALSTTSEMGARATISISGISQASMHHPLGAAAPDAPRLLEQILELLLKAGADANRPLPECAPTQSALLMQNGSQQSTCGRSPLLAAIDFKVARLVVVLLESSSLRVNGEQGSEPALHAALHSLQLAIEAAAAANIAASDPHGVGSIARGGHTLAKSSASSFASPSLAATGAARLAGIAASAALNIFTTLVRDARVNLNQPCPASKCGVMVQLAHMGGARAFAAAKAVAETHRLSPEGLNMRAPDGRTALHIAAERGDGSLLDLLVAQPATDCNLLDNTGKSALACAVAAGCVEGINRLVRAASKRVGAACLNPGACSPDNPASSPMGLALAAQDTKMLVTMLYAIKQHDPYHVVPSGDGGSDWIMNGTLSRRPPTEETVGYNLDAFVNEPMGGSGHAPILWACSSDKWEHVQALLEYGAHLDVLVPPASAAAIKSAQGLLAGVDADGLELADCTPLHLVLIRCAKLASQHVIPAAGSIGRKSLQHLPQGLSELKSLAEKMAKHPSAAKAVGLQDRAGYTPIHWAVAAGLEQVVSVLAGKATPADLEKPTLSDGSTALMLAVQLNHVRIAKDLKNAGASVEAKNIRHENLHDLCSSDDMRKVLNAPVDNKVHQRSLHGPESKGTGKSNLYVELKHDVKSKWAAIGAAGEMVIKSDPAPDLIGGPRTNSTFISKSQASTLYEAFRQTVKALANSSKALGDWGAPLAFVLTLVDSTMDMADNVQLNNAMVSHICSRVKITKPMLQRLQQVAQRNAAGSDSNAEHVKSTIEAVGNIMIDIHRIIMNWSEGTKANMITRFLASNSYKEDFLELNTRLSDTINDCAFVLAACGYVDNRSQQQQQHGSKGVSKEEEKQKAREAAAEAVKEDVQNLVRDILEAEAAGGEGMEEWSYKAQTLYNSYGLDFKKIKRNEKQRWKAEKLRDLVITYNDIQLMHHLGKGGSGTVHQALWQGVMVAVKLFDQPFEKDAKAQLRKEVENEGYIMSTLRHPNIAQFYGIILENHQCGLVVQKYKCSLDSLLHASNTMLTPLRSVELALQVAHGMAYLHGRPLEPVVHGDLKPTNVLLTEDGRAVITDFGLARVQSTAAGGTLTSTMHNPARQYTSSMSMVYTAPEVTQDMIKFRRRKPPSDVFSFGVLLLEVLIQKPAHTYFDSIDEYIKAMERGIRPEVPAELPAPLRDLIARCWAQNPAERPAFPQIVQTLKLVLKHLQVVSQQQQ